MKKRYDFGFDDVVREAKKIRKFKFKKTRRVEWVLVGVVVALFLFMIWANFIYYKNCENQACFEDYLADCSRAKFVNMKNMTFEYKISGRNSEGCAVDVELLRGDLSNQDSLVLQGKTMQCSLPFGAVAFPESDIGNCHGLLKEDLQDLIIKKMHTYIVQNLERINFDIY